ncbi:hypothetical protein, partial [Roseiconus lacunae]|uniref:hypothetical protein n=1 Tax=Roseiconus lacunae TaxID=2605694 RepID=UPI001E5B72F4
FYRNGMRKNGLGPMTFDLERDARKQLRIVMVKGQKPLSGYSRESKDAIRDEVRQTFANVGLDFDREVVIIFQALLQRKPAETIEIGPFTGGGNGFKGSALVYDDVRLDAALLSSNRPDPFSKPGVTLGDFNSGYIGGAAHELGHAFGIGHDAERPSLTARIGRSLMGRGNHDFGEELRGKSRGAFLSAASALPLSVHPLFSENSGSSDPANFRFESLDSALTRNGLVLRGRVEGDAAPAILVAYNDPSTDPSDYDAVGWPTRIQSNGEFQLIVGDVVPGEYSLHVRVFSKEGAATRFSFPYRVDVRGNADLSSIHP